MPTVPVYTQQRNISANPGNILRNEAGQDIENTQKIIAATGQALQTWSNFQDTMQTNEYESKLSTGLLQLQQDVENEGDYNNHDKYINRLKDLRTDALSGVKNPQLAQQLAMKSERDFAIARIKIDSEFKQKQALKAEMDLDNIVKAKSLTRSSSLADTALIGTIDAEVAELIQRNVATKVITPARGRSLYDDYRLGGVDLDIMKDASLDKEGSFVYQNLLAGDKGIYKNLSPDERAERLEKAELHIRRNKIMNNFVQNQNQEANERTLLLNHGSQDITTNAVKDLLVATSIRKSFGEKYSKAMFTPPAEKTDYLAFNKVRLAQLNGAKQKDINSAVLDNIGLYTVDDKNRLVQASYNQLDSNTVNIKAGAEALYKWGVSISDENQAQEILFRFFNEIDSGNKDVNTVIETVQKDYIKKNNPSVALLNDVPNVIVNKNKIVSAYQKESKMAGVKVPKEQKPPVKQTIQELDFDSL